MINKDEIVKQLKRENIETYEDTKLVREKSRLLSLNLYISLIQ